MENSDNDTLKWHALPAYPITGGVSAPFIGVSNEVLLVGGGCNFPGKPAAEGGQKKFYSEVYSFDLSSDNPDGQWNACTPLPVEGAYGVSVNTNKGIIWAGGQSTASALSQVWLMRYDRLSAAVVYDSLPELPVTLCNAAATCDGDLVYISGGVSSDGSKGNIYCLNLADTTGGWRVIEIPSGYERQQPVFVVQNKQLLIGGGYDEQQGIAFDDIRRYNALDNCWEPFAVIRTTNGLPDTAIGTGATACSEHVFVVTGGVNYDLFNAALQRIRKRREAAAAADELTVALLNQQQQEYMKQPAAWYRFNTEIRLFHTDTRQWSSLGTCEELAKAGAGVVLHGNKLYLVGGELKPGIRTEAAGYICLPEEIFNQ